MKNIMSLGKIHEEVYTDNNESFIETLIGMESGTIGYAINSATTSVEDLLEGVITGLALANPNHTEESIASGLGLEAFTAVTEGGKRGYFKIKTIVLKAIDKIVKWFKQILGIANLTKSGLKKLKKSMETLTKEMAKRTLKGDSDKSYDTFDASDSIKELDEFQKETKKNVEAIVQTIIDKVDLIVAPANEVQPTSSNWTASYTDKQNAGTERRDAINNLPNTASASDKTIAGNTAYDKHLRDIETQWHIDNPGTGGSSKVEHTATTGNIKDISTVIRDDFKPFNEKLNDRVKELLKDVTSAFGTENVDSDKYASTVGGYVTTVIKALDDASSNEMATKVLSKSIKAMTKVRSNFEATPEGSDAQYVMKTLEVAGKMGVVLDTAKSVANTGSVTTEIVDAFTGAFNKIKKSLDDSEFHGDTAMYTAIKALATSMGVQCGTLVTHEYKRAGVELKALVAIAEKVKTSQIKYISISKAVRS